MKLPSAIKVLFVSSEVFPLIKTGGLADVSGSLPAALQLLGVDIRILMPGYPSVLDQLTDLCSIADLSLPFSKNAQLMMGMILGTQLQVMVVKCPTLYERSGGPYADEKGLEWPDNALRFGLLSKVAATLSGQETPLTNWQPDIVHCNDWQTGLTPAYMKLTENTSAKSIISIHNMAFQGIYPSEWIQTLGLPAANFTMQGFEYFGQLSFLKAGIYYADSITTVSPSYAVEIQTPAYGFGMEGLLAQRGNEIKGILNGIETEEWNPDKDVHLVKNYNATNIAGKRQVKKSLQKKLGLKIDAHAPLLGVVSRLTHQKGLDLLLPNMQYLIDSGCQLALLGSGEIELETAFIKYATNNPLQVVVTIGYNESLSHQIMAGCDIFIMPSRFEPCGLNQLYGLAYGTPPVVNATGGLADSVTDTTAISLKNKLASGFVMADASAETLLECIIRAIEIYKENKKMWRAIQKNGMTQNLSWDKSAMEYLHLYQALLNA